MVILLIVTEENILEDHIITSSLNSTWALVHSQDASADTVQELPAEVAAVLVNQASNRLQLQSQWNLKEFFMN